MAANLPCNLWNSHLYGNGIFVYRWLDQAKRPRLSAIVGGVLLYVLCAILDGYGITMHYMSASVGNLSGASGQHKRFLLGGAFLSFLMDFGKVVLTVVRCQVVHTMVIVLHINCF